MKSTKIGIISDSLEKKILEILPTIEEKCKILID